jgi:hypothetical protein
MPGATGCHYVNDNGSCTAIRRIVPLLTLERSAHAKSSCCSRPPAPALRVSRTCLAQPGASARIDCGAQGTAHLGAPESADRAAGG